MILLHLLQFELRKLKEITLNVGNLKFFTSNIELRVVSHDIEKVLKMGKRARSLNFVLDSRKEIGAFK